MDINMRREGLSTHTDCMANDNELQPVRSGGKVFLGLPKNVREPRDWDHHVRHQQPLLASRRNIPRHKSRVVSALSACVDACGRHG